MSKLISKYIFIDSSVFIQNNYIHSSKINVIRGLFEQDVVSLVLTDITINEIKAHLRDDIGKVEQEYNKRIKSFKKQWPILKNINVTEKYFEFNDIDFNKIKEGLLIELDSFLRKTKAIIVDCNDSSIKDVFNKYFSLLPPFKEGKKKYEFPDAFVLDTLEKWADKKKEMIYILTNDEDMKSYETEHFIFVDQLSTMIDMIIKSEVSGEYIIQINRILSEKTKKIVGEIRQYVIDEIYAYDNPVYGTYYSRVYELQEFIISDIEFESYSIIEIINDSAKIEYLINITYVVSVSYDDHDSAEYDKDDKLVMVKRTKKISKSKMVPCVFEINLSKRDDESVKMTDFNDNYYFDPEIE